MSAIAHKETTPAARTDRLDRFVFSTDSLPQRDRFDAYRDGLCLHHMKVDVRRLGDVAFRARIELKEAGGIVFGAMTASPTLHDRTGSLLADGNDGAVIYLGRRGRLVARQGAGEFEYGRGAGVLLRSGAECATETLTGAEVWTVNVPSLILNGILKPGRDIKPRPLMAGDASTRLLISYLSAMWDVSETADADLRQITGAHVADLVAHVIGVGGDEERTALGRGVKAARIQALMREIERRFADPHLCPERVGQVIGVSGRQVHRLMEEMPKTFNEQVLECRLNCARLLLTDPARAGGSIADIAHSAGFVSPAYFSRAFRVRFGEAPIAARMGAAGEARLLAG